MFAGFLFTEKFFVDIINMTYSCRVCNGMMGQDVGKILTSKPVMQRCKDGEWYEDRQTDRDSFGDVAERKGDGTGTGRNV